MSRTAPVMTAPDMNSTVAIRARRFEIAMIGTPSNVMSTPYLGPCKTPLLGPSLVRLRSSL